MIAWSTAISLSAVNDAVVVRDLVKRYNNIAPPAVDGLSFSVAKGEVFGLLGPNGAGKSTTIGVLTTRVLPTSGQVTIDGVDVVGNSTSAKRVLGVVPQRVNLDRSLNVRQNLLFHAAYHGVPRAERNRRADSVLEGMGLTDKAKARIDFLSGGQVQRVMISRALMHSPRVLFLDEPSTGLDPQSRLFVHERVAALRDEGVTVVVTTHDMDEAEKLCDRIGVIDHGKLLTCDLPENLARDIQGATTVTLTIGGDVEGLPEALAGLPGVERAEDLGEGRVRVFTDLPSGEILPAALRLLADRDREVRDVAVGRLSLEDVFIHITGREVR